MTKRSESANHNMLTAGAVVLISVVLAIVVVVDAKIQTTDQYKLAEIDVAEVMQQCEAICSSIKPKFHDSDTQWEEGPCLSDLLNQDQFSSQRAQFASAAQAGWVCDVAHSPRIDVDNHHTCKGYNHDGKFVEVTPSCTPIRQ